VIVSPRKSNSTLETPIRSSSSQRRKPKADLYTALLAVALVALLVAILFLYLFMSSYEFKFKGGPVAGVSGGRQSQLVCCLSERIHFVGAAVQLPPQPSVLS
jgi:hypothetical protein